MFWLLDWIWWLTSGGDCRRLLVWARALVAGTLSPMGTCSCRGGPRTALLSCCRMTLVLRPRLLDGCSAYTIGLRGVVS